MHPKMAPVQPASSRKRAASSVAQDGRPQKQTKRRASKACQSCRARKVRCNVVEQSPCTNCRLDEVECIISESKRKSRKPSIRIEHDYRPEKPEPSHLEVKPESSPAAWSVSPRRLSPQNPNHEEHVPHPLYRTHGNRPTMFSDLHRPSFSHSTWPQPRMSEMVNNQSVFNPVLMSPALSDALLPEYIKPIPSRLGSDEISYLVKKGALSLPPIELRNELLQCFIEHVDPGMPIIDMDQLLQIVEAGDGSAGQISLLLLQAIMFTACAFVDTQYLQRAGFPTRKDARRAFYMKTRLLYDFDYENDRVVQVQALLMMSYWYESPDDQKNTWHWMGLAISTAQTIGLNRNPARLDSHKRRQWRRIAWTLIIRDRVIALGMRKTPRVSIQDFEVPMLTLDDFELKCLSTEMSCISPDFALARDLESKTSLANMFIAQAELSLVIGRVLSAQYSVSEQSMNEEGNARISDTLVPKAGANDATQIDLCHRELTSWFSSLPTEALPSSQRKLNESKEPTAIIVNRALLHMIYYTALSALHRPQASQSILLSQPTPEISKSAETVHTAARQTTRLAQSLLQLNLARYLPTTGITVLLPAITSHIMDIKSATSKIRRTGLTSFCHCIQLMARLRDIYAAADFTVRLIEMAIRRASIDLPIMAPSTPSQPIPLTGAAPATPPQSKASTIDDLLAEALRNRFISPQVSSANNTANPHTPPPEEDDDDNEDDAEVASSFAIPPPPEAEIPRLVSTFLASSGPHSAATAPSTPFPHQPLLHHAQHQHSQDHPTTLSTTSPHDLDRDFFDSLINSDQTSDDAPAYPVVSASSNLNTSCATLNSPNMLQGESSAGFSYDLDWINLVTTSTGPVSVVDPTEEREEEVVEGREGLARFEEAACKGEVEELLGAFEGRGVSPKELMLGPVGGSVGGVEVAA